MTQQREWLQCRIAENDMNWRKVAKECYEDYCDIFYSTTNRKNFTQAVRRAYAEMSSTVEDAEQELADSSILERRNQSLRDKNNYLTRQNRNFYRSTNLVEETYEALNETVKEIKWDFKLKDHAVKPTDKSAIVCLSDLHLNTLVSLAESDHEYNFEVASKRLQKYITIVKDNCKKLGVKTVYLVNLGDIISSNRRYDEKLSQISSQTTALLLAVHLVQQAICDLNKDFVVKVTGIIGNESRIQDDFNYAPINAAENYDWLVLSLLAKVFEDKPQVEFMFPKNPIKGLLQIPLAEDKVFNCVIAHGNLIKKPCEGAERVYTNEYIEDGNVINLCLFGHFHHNLITGKAVYTGTMMGGNSYSAACGFPTKAFQTMVVVNNDGSFWALPINVHETDGFEGYEFQKELEPFAYLQHQGKQAYEINIKLI